MALLIGYKFDIKKLETKQKRKVKKESKFIVFFRQLFFLTSCVFVRHASWIILPVLGTILNIRYLFLVNAGSDSDLDGYCPRWLAKSWYFSGRPTIGGLITDKSGKYGRGLYLALPNTAKELMGKQGNTICVRMVKRLRRIRFLVGAKSIALSGQIPGVISRHKNIKISKPFVFGIKGTVFCVVDTINKVLKKHKLVAGKFRIAIVGVGNIGGSLMKTLEQRGHAVFGIDIIKKGKKVYLKDEGQIQLAQADMVVVLTPKGSDFNPYLKWLKSGAIIIDDTHPKIIKKPRGVLFYKVAVALPGVRFLPKLPGYNANWIPGCAVEAIMSQYTGEFNGRSQKEFNAKAKEIGFSALLVG